MKGLSIMIVVLVVAGLSLMAQGNVESIEKLTEVEGTVEIVQDATGRPTVLLTLDDGTQVELQVPEAVRMLLQNRERIKLEGVYLGPTEQFQTGHQLFVRSMTRNGVRTPVENPVRLNEQQQLQLRAYEGEQLQTRTQSQNQNQVHTGGDQIPPGTTGPGTPGKGNAGH